MNSTPVRRRENKPVARGATTAWALVMTGSAARRPAYGTVRPQGYTCTAAIQKAHDSAAPTVASLTAAFAWNK